MASNTGIPYEYFVQHIFDQIVNQNSVKTIKIQHNVILQGIKITHQIDVYWEFEVGGIKYSTVVQAKDWNQSVDQGELIKFKGVIDDIPSQPKGIFVTKTGFQTGAKDFAEKSGILLYELRQATEDDLKNRIKIFSIHLNCYVPDTTGFKLILDNDWFKKERSRLNIASDGTFTLQTSGMSDELIFTDINGKRLISGKEIIHSFCPTQIQETSPVLKTYEFDCVAFTSTTHSKFPKIKVNAVQATFSVSKIEQEIEIKSDDIVRFILWNLIDDSDHLFDKDVNLVK
ncbi:MAG: restriction endonuclease [candidate division Zixibacteria bacterium]